jgi:uncharacterized glyoxalase superfamily protein PhnB
VTDSTGKLNSLIPMLQASSVAQTIAFYRDTLGFNVGSVYPDDEEPTWCNVQHGHVSIMFYEMDEHEHEEGEEHDHDHPDSPVMTGSLYLYPDDVDALWQELKDKVEVAWPLQDMEYGMREFAILDPNGYILNFGRSIES